MNKNLSLKQRREKMIYEQIDYKFKDPKLLEQAFTCPSAIQYKLTNLNESYQRLEFLGDTILKMVITELIFQIYPSYNEGQLSKKREELEKNKALCIISKRMGLTEFAVKYNREKTNFKMEADLIEAMIGAIMIDSNYDYKMTRYHTLLLIRENIEKDIDYELFFEYVQKCKAEIIESNNLPQFEEQIKVNNNLESFKRNNNGIKEFEIKKEQKIEKSSIKNNICESSIEMNISSNEKSVNSISFNTTEISEKDDIDSLSKSKINNNKNKIAEIKLFDINDINQTQNQISLNNSVKTNAKIFEDINNYVMDDD